MVQISTSNKELFRTNLSVNIPLYALDALRR